MKKTLCIITMLLLINCSDRKTTTEEDLKQYPWIEVFTSGRVDFKGIEQNLDLGTYSFSFKTSYSQIDTFLKITDSRAINDKWEIVKKNENSRKYKKKSTVYSAADGFDFVSLAYDAHDGRIRFTFSQNK